MDIVFWQLIPSHHLSGAMQHLAETWNRPVHAVFDLRMLSERKIQGWQPPDMGSIEPHFLEGKKNPNKFVSDFITEHRNAIHILSGFRGCHSVDLAWKKLRQDPTSHLAVIAERPDMRTWKSHLKKLWYKHFIIKYRHRFKAILPMGRLGMKWFQCMGWPDDVLFPFIYQYDGTTNQNHSKHLKDSTDELKLVYVGQFIKRKGCDLLLKATRALPSKGWSLDLVGGGGELSDYVRKFIETCRLPIQYFGKWNSKEVVSCLQKYDVCIVPSRHDGWGMVVNEAIEAGLGVIVSDRTGASDLVEVSGAGTVVASNRTSELSEAIRNVLKKPVTIQAWRKRAIDFTPRISTKMVGTYLHDVLEYTFFGKCIKRPQAPWLM